MVYHGLGYSTETIFTGVFKGNLPFHRFFKAKNPSSEFHGLYNVPVESKTVKFDITVHLRDSTFTPPAMQSPTTYKFKDILTII